MSDLRSRARQHAGKEEPPREVARPDQTLAAEIRRMEDQFALAAPKGAEASQLVRDALTCLRQTPKLAECDAQSVLGALMTCAQLGLRPGVLGHAWLLPFWDNKSRTNKAQLVVGYQGLVELAHRSGKIADIIARTVHEGEEFDVAYGLSETLVHKPNIDGDKGAPRAYYAVVRFVNGGHAFYVMSHREMLAYRDKHAKAKSREGTIFGPWATEFEGMAHKTCVRQLSKWMPKSTDLATAIAADETIRVDLDPRGDAAVEGYHPPAIEGAVVDVPDEEPPADAPAEWPEVKEPPS